MRRSRDRDNIILEDADGKPYGIYLAADFTAAHEEGIERLEKMFGIDRSLPGIPGRTISRSVTHVAFREKSIRVETSESKKGRRRYRSEEHTSELQSLMRISYAVFCLKKKKTHRKNHKH